MPIRDADFKHFNIFDITVVDGKRKRTSTTRYADVAFRPAKSARKDFDSNGDPYPPVFCDQTDSLVDCRADSRVDDKDVEEVEIIAKYLHNRCKARHNKRLGAHVRVKDSCLSAPHGINDRLVCRQLKSRSYDTSINPSTALAEHVQSLRPGQLISVRVGGEQQGVDRDRLYVNNLPQPFSGWIDDFLQASGNTRPRSVRIPVGSAFIYRSACNPTTTSSCVLCAICGSVSRTAETDSRWLTDLWCKIQFVCKSCIIFIAQLVTNVKCNKLKIYTSCISSTDSCTIPTTSHSFTDVDDEKENDCSKPNRIKCHRCQLRRTFAHLGSTWPNRLKLAAARALGVPIDSFTKLRSKPTNQLDRVYSNFLHFSLATNYRIATFTAVHDLASECLRISKIIANRAREGDQFDETFHELEDDFGRAHCLVKSDDRTALTDQLDLIGYVRKSGDIVDPNRVVGIQRGEIKPRRQSRMPLKYIHDLGCKVSASQRGPVKETINIQKSIAWPEAIEAKRIDDTKCVDVTSVSVLARKSDNGHNRCSDFHLQFFTIGNDDQTIHTWDQFDNSLHLINDIPLASELLDSIADTAVEPQPGSNDRETVKVRKGTYFTTFESVFELTLDELLQLRPADMELSYIARSPSPPPTLPSSQPSPSQSVSENERNAPTTLNFPHKRPSEDLDAADGVPFAMPPSLGMGPLITQFTAQKPDLSYRQLLVISMYVMRDRGGRQREISHSLAHLFPYFTPSRLAAGCRSALRYNLLVHPEFVGSASRGRGMEFFLAPDIESTQIFHSVKNHLRPDNPVDVLSDDVCDTVNESPFATELDSFPWPNIDCKLDSVASIHRASSDVLTAYLARHEVPYSTFNNLSGCMVAEHQSPTKSDNLTNIVSFELCLSCASPIECDAPQTVRCRQCCNAFHSFCIPFVDLPLSQFDKQWDWICRRCKICQCCGLSSAPPSPGHTVSGPPKIVCGLCCKAYHGACVDNLCDWLARGIDTFLDIWFCPDCLRCTSCGAKGATFLPSDGPSHESTGSGRMKWNADESLCVKCVKARELGQYCTLCGMAYDNDDYDSRMVECVRCQCWVHTECEELHSEDYYQVLSQLPEDVEFVCRDMTTTQHVDACNLVKESKPPRALVCS